MKKTIPLLLAALLAAFAGCTWPPKPYEYHNEKDEMPGPGLFSGEDGGFVIYNEPGEEKSKPEEKEEGEAADKKKP